MNNILRSGYPRPPRSSMRGASVIIKTFQLEIGSIYAKHTHNYSQPRILIQHEYFDSRFGVMAPLRLRTVRHGGGLRLRHSKQALNWILILLHRIRRDGDHGQGFRI